jgi:hypothetical protein
LKNNQLYLYICIYVISAIFDQSWKKERKKIEKYFKSSCLRELKIKFHHFWMFYNKTIHSVAQEGGRHQQGQLSEKRKNSKRKLYLHDKHDALVHTKCFGPVQMQKPQNILI